MESTNNYLFINQLISYLKTHKSFNTIIRLQNKSLTKEEYQMIIELSCLYKQLIKQAIDKDLPIIINENYISISIYYQGTTITFKEYQNYLIVEQNRIPNQEINYSSIIKKSRKLINF